MREGNILYNVRTRSIPFLSLHSISFTLSLSLYFSLSFYIASISLALSIPLSYSLFPSISLSLPLFNISLSRSLSLFLSVYVCVCVMGVLLKMFKNDRVIYFLSSKLTYKFLETKKKLFWTFCLFNFFVETKFFTF